MQASVAAAVAAAAGARGSAAYTACAVASTAIAADAAVLRGRSHLRHARLPEQCRRLLPRLCRRTRPRHHGGHHEWTLHSRVCRTVQGRRGGQPGGDKHPQEGVPGQDRKSLPQGGDAADRL